MTCLDEKGKSDILSYCNYARKNSMFSLMVY